MMSGNWQAIDWSGSMAKLRTLQTRIAAPTHTQAIKLMDYWHERPADGLRMGRDMPSRKVASLLSYIMIWEPEPDGSDLVVRHAGEAVAYRFGINTKGRRLSALVPRAENDSHQAVFSDVIRTQEPVVIDTVLRNDAVELMHLELVVLPVFAACGIARWAMAGMFYFR